MFKHADIQLHLGKFLLSHNMFLSIAVVSHKPIVHHPSVYRLVENHVRDDYCTQYLHYYDRGYTGNTAATYHQHKLT